MSKLFSHAVLKKRLNFRLYSTIFAKGLNRSEKYNCNLLKHVHSSQPLLCYSQHWRRFKEYSKNYWYLLGPIYISNNILWFLICHCAVKKGFNVLKLLQDMGVSDKTLEFLTSHIMGKHTLSFLLYKLLTPFRVLTLLKGSRTIIEYVIVNNLLPPKPISIWKNKAK